MSKDILDSMSGKSAMTVSLMLPDKSTFFLIPTFNLTYCVENLGFQHSNFQRPESLQLSIVQTNCKIKKYSILDGLSCGQYFSQH